MPAFRLHDTRYQYTLYKSLETGPLVILVNVEGPPVDPAPWLEALGEIATLMSDQLDWWTEKFFGVPIIMPTVIQPEQVLDVLQQAFEGKERAVSCRAVAIRNDEDEEAYLPFDVF